MRYSAGLSSLIISMAPIAAHAEGEKQQSPAQVAIEQYDTTVGGLSGHVAERYAAYRSNRRDWYLGDPVETYKFHLANMSVLSANSPKQSAQDLKDLLSWSRRPRRHESILGEGGKDWVDTFAAVQGGINYDRERAVASLLCEPVAEKSAAEARLAPLAAAGGNLKAGARPSGRAGMSLFAHALTHNYRIAAEPISIKPNDEVYAAALRDCVDDLTAARAPLLTFSRSTDSEGFISGFGAGLTAINTLIGALNTAFDGLGRMIENRKIDSAVREYIQELEPFPEFKAKDKATAKAVSEASARNRALNEEISKRNDDVIKQYKAAYEEYEKRPEPRGEPPAPPELEPLKSNVIRGSIKSVVDDLQRLTKEQRIRAARHYYIEFLNYADALAMVAPGGKLSIVDREGVRTIVLHKLSKDGEDVVLTKAGMTSSARFEAINAHFKALDLEARQTALLAAADAYDLARDASGVADSAVALSSAWTRLAKYAYGPKSEGLGSALAMLTEIQKTMAGVDTAFKEFEKSMDALTKKKKKEEEKKEEKKEETDE